MQLVPTIDVEAWRISEPAARREIARHVDHALRTSGFLVATNHGIPSELAAEVREHSLAFFRLPAADKQPYQCRVGGRGWIGPGAEANSYASGVAAPPDLKESYKIGYHPNGTPLANVWPGETPGLQPAVENYLSAVWRLAQDLFRLFAEALELPDDPFNGSASAEASSLNLNWYPAYNQVGEPDDGQFRIGAHSDFGALTILDRQSGDRGLQIQTTNGDWVDAPDVPGALTLNIGDMLAHWTGDRWRSTVHRVLPPSDHVADEELLSLVAFCGIDPDTVLRTLDIGGPNQYEPVRAGDYIDAKLRAIDVA